LIFWRRRFTLDSPSENSLIMSSSRTRLDRPDGVSIQLYRWLPETEPLAAVQIVHGLSEHAGRYARVATALNKAGFAVYASDLRGHGTACPRPDLGFFSERAGWRKCLEDLWAVHRRIETALPDVPVVFLGHSMGSFLVQQLIAEHGDNVAGAVLSGSNGAPPPLATLGRLIARLERVRLGQTGHSALLRDLMFGGFNKPFAPTRTPFDWLSSDEAKVDAFVADPACGNDFTVQLAIDLLDALGPLTSPATVAGIPKDLPIYIFSGENDPVGPNLKGLIQAYRNAGLTRVTSRIYPGGRHEMLNEINRDEVTRDLIAWLDANVG
jgi:alpha-beta hydrolase superfamily lysophospholipase